MADYCIKLAKLATLVDSMGCFRQSKEDEDDQLRKEANKRIERQLAKDKLVYRGTHRLLLLGRYGDDSLLFPFYIYGGHNAEIIRVSETRFCFLHFHG